MKQTRKSEIADEVDSLISNIHSLCKQHGLRMSVANEFSLVSQQRKYDTPIADVDTLAHVNSRYNNKIASHCVESFLAADYIHFDYENDVDFVIKVIDIFIRFRLRDYNYDYNNYDYYVRALGIREKAYIIHDAVLLYINSHYPQYLKSVDELTRLKTINLTIELIVKVINQLKNTAWYANGSLHRAMDKFVVFVPEDTDHAMAVIDGKYIIRDGYTDGAPNTPLPLMNLITEGYSYKYMSKLQGTTSALRVLQKALKHVPKEDLAVFNINSRTTLWFNDPAIVTMAEMLLPNKKALGGFTDPRPVFIANSLYKKVKKQQNSRKR